MRRGWMFLCLILLMGSPLIPITSAHYDPPKNPPLHVQVILKRVVLLQDMDDGLDGNGEVFISGSGVSHTNHSPNMPMFIDIDDFDWDKGKARSLGDNVFYSHRECTPFPGLKVDIQIQENDGAGYVITVILTAIAAVAAIVGSAASTGSVTYWAVTGGVAAVLAALSANPHDDLGKGSLSVTKAGAYKIKTKGADGGAEFEFEVKVTALAPGASYNCDFASGKVASLIPAGSSRNRTARLEEGRAAFGDLREAVAQASVFQVEEGNPKELTELEIANLSTEIPTVLLQKTVDPWITLLVKMGSDFSQDEEVEAIEALEIARNQTLEGNFQDAINSYQNAWEFSINQLFPETFPEGQSPVSISVIDSLTGEAPKGIVVEVLKGSTPIYSTIATPDISAETLLSAGNYVVKAKTQIVGIPIELASQGFSVQGPTTLTVMVSALFIPVAWLPNVAFAGISLVPGVILRSASSRLLRKRGFRRAGVVGGILGLAGFLASYSYFTLV